MEPPRNARFYFDQSRVSEGAYDAATVAEFCGVFPNMPLDRESSTVLAEFTAMERMGLPTHFLPNPLSETRTSFKTRQRGRGVGSSYRSSHGHHSHRSGGCSLGSGGPGGRPVAPRKEPEVVFTAPMPGKWTRSHQSQPAVIQWHSEWMAEYAPQVEKYWLEVVSSWHARRSSTALASGASSAGESLPSNSNAESSDSCQGTAELRHCVARTEDVSTNNASPATNAEATDEVHTPGYVTSPVAETVPSSTGGGGGGGGGGGACLSSDEVAAWHGELDRCSSDLDKVWKHFYNAQYESWHEVWKASRGNALCPGVDVLGMMRDDAGSDEESTSMASGSLDPAQGDSDMEEGEVLDDSDDDDTAEGYCGGGRAGLREPVVTSSRYSVPGDPGHGELDSEDDSFYDEHRRESEGDSDGQILKVSVPINESEVDIGGICARISPGTIAAAEEEEEEDEYEGEEDGEMYEEGEGNEEEGEEFQSQSGNPELGAEDTQGDMTCKGQNGKLDKGTLSNSPDRQLPGHGSDVPSSEETTTCAADEAAASLKRKSSTQATNEESHVKRLHLEDGSTTVSTFKKSSRPPTTPLPAAPSMSAVKDFIAASKAQATTVVSSTADNATTPSPDAHPIPAYPGAYNSPVCSPSANTQSTDSASFSKKGKNKKRKNSGRRMSNAPSDPSLNKFYAQRYRFFSRFDEGIEMDDEGWFSVTPEKIAQRIAERCQCDLVIDAFCGVGGNSIQFALTCERVIAIDIDPAKIKYARHNAAIYGVEDRIEFIVGDVFDVLPTMKADVLFFSPPWGGPKYLNATEYDVFKMLPVDVNRLFAVSAKVTPNIAFYAPRNMPEAQFAQLASLVPSRVDIEQYYLNDKLKVLVSYFGELVNFHATSEEPEDEKSV